MHVAVLPSYLRPVWLYLPSDLEPAQFAHFWPRARRWMRNINEIAVVRSKRTRK
jgi:hypothetical protein